MTVTIMSNGELRTLIGEIGSTATALQDSIHNAGVSCLAHIRDHGDTTLMTSLLGALPNGQRVKALAYWAAHFSNDKATFYKDKDTNEWSCKLAKDRVPEDFDIEGAYDMSFADLTAEKEPKTLDLDGLEKYLKRVANNGDFFKGTQIRKVSEQAQEAAAKLTAALRTIRAAA